jgi:hypothetical protein
MFCKKVRNKSLTPSLPLSLTYNLCSGAIQPERTGTPFRFKDFLENGVPVHFGKIQTELTIL